MSDFISKLTKRINGGGIPSFEKINNSITTSTTSTGTITTINTPTITDIVNGSYTGITFSTGTNGTIYTTGTGGTLGTGGLVYNPYNFTMSGSYYNLENINIDALRKFITREISFVDDLIEIDDSDSQTCTMILSVSKEMYGELEIDYIFDKVEDYIKEKISGLISCMDPEFDQGRMNIMFIPKSTLLDIINNDNEE